MCLLRLVLLTAVLAAGLAPSAASASSCTPIMPLEEIQPGMKGYGLTVFRGTEPERFEFEVRGVIPDFNGWPRVIVVQLSGGPKDKNGKDLFDSGQIFGGMSGSPMYIDGKLIGGLAMAKDFQTTAKTLITPIQYQLELARIEHPESAEVPTVKPGEYVGMCLVYGDSDRCIRSTVTEVCNNHIFTTSHSVGLPYGKTEFPVFKVPVVDLLESQSGATKLAGVRGEAIGTAVVAGAYGMVVHQGPLPKSIPVTLTIHDVYHEPKVARWQMPYDRQSTGNLKDALATMVTQLPVEAKSSRMKAVIRLQNPRGVITVEDTDAATTGSVERILDKLLKQEGDALAIDGIDLEYRILKTNELWAPFAIQVAGRGNQGEVKVLARKGDDNELGEFTAPIDLTQIRRAKLPTQWLDGSNLLGKILERMPVRDALPLLEQTREHEALYLVTIESDETLRIEWSKKGEVKKARPPTITVLASTTMGGRRFMMEGGKPMPFTAKP
jgi:hypothetical protein